MTEQDYAYARQAAVDAAFPQDLPSYLVVKTVTLAEARRLVDVALTAYTAAIEDADR